MRCKSGAKLEGARLARTPSYTMQFKLVKLQLSLNESLKFVFKTTMVNKVGQQTLIYKRKRNTFIILHLTLENNP